MSNVKQLNKSYKLWKIAVYIRLSKEDERANESESVVNQKKILIEYLEHFFDEDYDIVDFYIDDGLTGTDDTRESFMRMILDIEKGIVNCVLCKTLARAFRNYADQGHYLEVYFPQKNVRFISTGDPKIDTFLNPDVLTGLEVPITGLMNDRFACRTSNDIRRTFNTKRRNGEFIGAFAPYGYLKDPDNKNRLIIDPEIAPIKRDMLNWILGGMSLRGVALKLNEMGILNPSAYKKSKGFNYCNPQSNKIDGLWTGTSVKSTLLAKVNLGHMVQGKQRVISYKVHDRINLPEDEWFYVENTHEPIFTQEEYDTLKRILSKSTRTPNKKRKVHIFSGLLICADCNKALHRKTSKGYTYYACRTYLEKSKTKCTKHSIRLDNLEKAVLQTIKTQIKLLDIAADKLDEMCKSPEVQSSSNRIEKAIFTKQQELEKKKQISDSLYEDWKTKEITKEEYRRMKVKYDEQIQKTLTSLANLQKEKLSIKNIASGNTDIFENFKKYKNVCKLDRNLLVELIDCIKVYENNRITIRFRFIDQIENVFEHLQLNFKENHLNIN